MSPPHTFWSNSTSNSTSRACHRVGDSAPTPSPPKPSGCACASLPGRYGWLVSPKPYLTQTATQTPYPNSNPNTLPKHLTQTATQTPHPNSNPNTSPKQQPTQQAKQCTRPRHASCAPAPHRQPSCDLTAQMTMQLHKLMHHMTRHSTGAEPAQLSHAPASCALT